jgi:hypothetical protein
MYYKKAQPLYVPGSPLDHLQEFAISTWHPSNFGNTRKNSLQQFGKITWHQ